MMKQIKNGFAEYYYLSEDGTIYNSAADKTIKPNREHTFIIRTINNKRKKISLKTLYKLVYDKNYCIDNIKDLDNEKWKQIDDTDNNYYISNYGRVKSLHGY